MWKRDIRECRVKILNIFHINENANLADWATRKPVNLAFASFCSRPDFVFVVQRPQAHTLYWRHIAAYSEDVRYQTISQV